MESDLSTKDLESLPPFMVGDRILILGDMSNSPRTVISLIPITRTSLMGTQYTEGWQYSCQRDDTRSVSIEHMWSMRLNPNPPPPTKSWNGIQGPSLSQMMGRRTALGRTWGRPASYPPLRTNVGSPVSSSSPLSKLSLKKKKSPPPPPGSSPPATSARPLSYPPLLRASGAPLMNQSNPTSTGYKPGSPSANISDDSPMHSSDDSILVLASKSVCCDSPISDKAASDDNLLAEKSTPKLGEEQLVKLRVTVSGLESKSAVVNTTPDDDDTTAFVPSLNFNADLMTASCLLDSSFSEEERENIKPVSSQDLLDLLMTTQNNDREPSVMTRKDLDDDQENLRNSQEVECSSSNPVKEQEEQLQLINQQEQQKISSPLRTVTERMDRMLENMKKGAGPAPVSHSPIHPDSSVHDQPSLSKLPKVKMLPPVQPPRKKSTKLTASRSPSPPPMTDGESEKILPPVQPPRKRKSKVTASRSPPPPLPPVQPRRKKKNKLNSKISSPPMTVGGNGDRTAFMLVTPSSRATRRTASAGISTKPAMFTPPCSPNLATSTNKNENLLPPCPTNRGTYMENLETKVMAPTPEPKLVRSVFMENMDGTPVYRKTLDPLNFSQPPSSTTPVNSLKENSGKQDASFPPPDISMFVNREEEDGRTSSVAKKLRPLVTPTALTTNPCYEDSDDESSDEELSDEDDQSKLTEAQKTANRKKFKNSFPPRNPHKIFYTGEDGKDLPIDSDDYLVKFASDQKITEETRMKYEREFNMFLGFTTRSFPDNPSITDDILSSSLPATEVCSMLCHYLVDRCNLSVYRETQVVVPLDTSTQELMWYAIAHMFKVKTTYRITTDAEFALARETKCSQMRKAKSMAGAGLGQLSRQMLPLSLSQLMWILSNDMLNLNTARGLQWLGFVLINLYFLPRVREECHNIKRGDFVRVKDASGQVVGVLYVPMGTTKRDRGNVKAHDCAGYFKRPFAMVTQEDKLNWNVVFGVFERELDKLPHEGSRDTQNLFHQVRSGIQKPGDPMFLPGNLGIDSYDRLLKTAIWATGLEVHKLQLPNQALRPTIFCLHRRLGVRPKDTAANAGHSSKSTQETYKRGDLVYSAEVNSKIQEVIGGVCTVKPESEYVRLVNGDVMKPRPFNKPINRLYVTPEAGFLPLTSMDLDDYYKHVPAKGIPIHSSWHVDDPTVQTPNAGGDLPGLGDDLVEPLPKKAKNSTASSRSSLPISKKEKGKGKGKRSYP